MDRRDPEQWTTGQIARRTGITLRTLRYYDQIGLLKPADRRISSARRYGKEDLIRLQKIQALKYIGMPLADIQRIIDDPSLPERDLKSSFLAQQEMIRHKINHMQFVSQAIEEAIGMLDRQTEEADWDGLARIMETIRQDRDWGAQYRNAARLQARIRLYDRFGENPMGWHRWLFERLPLKGELKVADIGCGDGSLWRRNGERIPTRWSVTLADISSGMLEAARLNLGDLGNRMRFVAADVQALPFEDGEFDVVIAGHMLYHVGDIPRAIAELRRILKPGGTLYATTMGIRHLREMEELAREFQPDMQVLDPVMERFRLENGEAILRPWFPVCETIRYVDGLRITEAEPLIQYMASTPMNAGQYMTGETLERFREHVRGRLEREGSIDITADTGMFRAVKSE